MRINKYIARAGVCSRRKADDLISQGLVKINGNVISDFGIQVFPDDQVLVNGRSISPTSLVYILLNKPGKVVTTTKDEKGRRTVLDLITMPEHDKKGLFPIGRLDRDTVGVLLLTTDGDLAHRLMHPRYEIEKYYKVTTAKDISEDEINRLQNGVMLDDGKARAKHAGYIEKESRNSIGIMLHEGRNRQIRRMIEAIGHEVKNLERVRYAGITSKGLRRGRWRQLQPHEVRRLKNLVKLK